jgi:hypothetical protein
MGGIGRATARPRAQTEASPLVDDVLDARGCHIVAAITATCEQADPGYMMGAGLIVDGGVVTAM